MSCIYLTCKAAMGGIAAPAGTEQEEWLTAVRKDQPEEVQKSIRFSQGVVLGHAVVCAASILSGPVEINLLFHRESARKHSSISVLSGAAACHLLVMLTRGFLMTSSPSAGSGSSC